MRISRLASWSGLALVLVLALATAGCSRTQTDAQLAGEVQNKINSKHPKQPITVTAQQGVVTLTGAVNDEEDRRAAATDASQVEGVKVVVNDLQVTPAAASIPEAAAVPAPQYEPAPRRASSPRHRAVSPANGPTSAATQTTAAPQVAPAGDVTVSRPVEPPPIQHITIPAGTPLSVRMSEGVDSAKNQMGDTFRATLESPIMVDDQVVAPQGTEVVGRLAALKSAGRLTGRAEMALELIRLDMNGKSYPLDTTQWTAQGRSEGKRTAATVGGGAAIGAIIGAIAGGGRGAAIGSVAGAGAGTGVSAATKGKQVKVDPEAVLQFRLQTPVTVTPSSERYGDRPRLGRDAERQQQQPLDQDPNRPRLERQSPPGNP